MNFLDAAYEVGNWIWQNKADSAVIGALAIAGVTLALRARKDERESYRESEEIVRKFVSRPDNRKPLPPHSPRT